MERVKVLVAKTSDTNINKILNSSFINEEDIRYLEKFTNLDVRLEKAISLVYKRKYIGDFSLNEYGKPISTNKEFNISHSKGLVVFVLDKAPVGIDCELIRDVKPNLVDYISSIEEKEYIKDNKTFFEVWTIKESIVKCLGTGLNSKVDEIISLPIDSIKDYKGHKLNTRTITYDDYVISVTRESDEDFEIEVVKENLNFMDKHIAYCGLDCTRCDARIATVTNNEELKEAVAKYWSEWNKTLITKEMVNCEGCRLDGVKTPFCKDMCEIKKCASSKNYETCADCKDVETCEKVKMITDHDKEAYNRLRNK